MCRIFQLQWGIVLRMLDHLPTLFCIVLFHAYIYKTIFLTILLINNIMSLKYYKNTTNKLKEKRKITNGEWYSEQPYW